MKLDFCVQENLKGWRLPWQAGLEREGDQTKLPVGAQEWKLTSHKAYTPEGPLPGHLNLASPAVAKVTSVFTSLSCSKGSWA